MCCCCRKKKYRLLEDQELLDFNGNITVVCLAAQDANPNCATVNVRKWAIDEPSKESVCLTGRTLFLRENLTTAIIDRRYAGQSNFTKHEYELYNRAQGWNGESYTARLDLTDTVLNSWSGKQVLDLGGGRSFFPEEAAVLGISVTVVDLNRDDYIQLAAAITPSVDDANVNVTGVANARLVYVRNMEILYCENGRQNFIHPALRQTFASIFPYRSTIANNFMDANLRQAGNATDLSAFANNTFDAVISVWMLCYLNEQDIQTVITEAVRVTRPGGQLRLYGGDNTRGRREAIGEGSFETWFGNNPTISGKSVRISRSAGGLLILQVL